MIRFTKVALGTQGLTDFKVPGELKSIVVGDRLNFVAF